MNNPQHIRTATGADLDALSPVPRLPGEGDAALRARVRAERDGPRPGTSAHLLATCQGFDKGAKVLELIGTVIVVADLDGDQLENLRTVLDDSRPMGVHLILTNDPMDSFGRMLAEARLEGARQERALTWRARISRWWGGR